MKTTLAKTAPILLILIGIIGIQTSFAQCAASLFAGGTGTEMDPYQISTAEQLQSLNQCLGSSNQSNYYVLNNDIDLTSYLLGTGNNSGAGWRPIGNSSSSNYFYGKFSGNSYKVSGLWINRTTNYAGLFGYATGAELKNIGVEIDDSKGGVKGGGYVGGLVGYNSGTISNSYATGAVTGTGDYVGGLAGYNIGTISNSYATGAVTGTGDYVGGLVGYNSGGCTISSSYATGSVTGSIYVGGLAGYNSGGTISSSYATGSVTGSSDVGGLAGYNSGGTISNSYATGSVTGTGINVGGLVGYNYNGGTISNSYATGSVTGSSYGYVGGLAGYNNGGTISGSYYDKETSGQSDTGEGIGKTTAEMKTQSTYEGWDFEEIWEISPARNNGYPSLLWQNPEHLGSATVAISNQTWTGNPITPKPNVAFKGNVLIEGVDFEFSYSDNIQTGTAILKIVGKGSYLGQAKVMEFTIVPATCGTGFAGGTGTEADPYKITDAQSLDAIGNCLGNSYSGKYYELQNDINLGSYIANTGTGWKPIGNIGSNNSFYGKFNGNGHKVSGLWINRTTNYVGLFGYAYNAELRNIGVEIDGSKGGVKGGSNVGGLVGWGYGGTISNSYATGSVTGTGNYFGGLVGWYSGGTISNSYATGSVTGTGINVGGLVGRSSGTVSNSYATGSVTGTGNYFGGLVGYNSGIISNSYATGSVTGSSSVGGLVGYSGGIISSSYATGSVTGSSSVGGLVGRSSGTVSSSYATGSVTGNSGVGGLVGYNSSDGTIRNSYATGSVTGSSSVGGLVGYSGGTISSSYATGSVTGTGNYFGGLVGYNSSDGTISSSYYDKETSGQSDTGKGVGKTTAEMKTQSTYEGWDFEEIWEINPAKNNGYPSLLWQNPNHIVNAIVATIPNQTWTGGPLTPKPSSVTFKGNVLSEGTDFVYSYDNNVQTGTAILKIVGKGTYQGQAKTLEFKIVPDYCGRGFAGGTGTETDPYKITDAKSLDAVSNCLGPSDKYYELQNDINLGSYIASTSAGWQPIGNSSNSFRGKFNGNGHKVSGLWINRTTNYVGLFGYAYNAELRNIGVEIDDSKGGVRGSNNVGGLVGYSSGTISNSYATGSVTGTGNYVGGLVGYGSSGTVSSSYATGSVTGNSGVGGLVGSGGITFESDGGISSYGNGVTISNSYATGSVTGTGNYVGGLVGINYGTISSNSYATGSVSGSNSVGGLVGRSSGTVSSSYATGSVTGTGNSVGGLVGINYGTIGNSYATGSVTGTGINVGGLVGYNSSDGTISSSYYDNETSGRTDTGKGVGKTTAEMKTQSTYEDWDFDSTWAIVNIINNGYPILQWQLQVKNAIVSSIPSQPYTSSAIEPAFTVTFNEITLTENTDYTVSYSNNVNAGIAKITISGIGEYLDSKEVSFAITAQPVTIIGVTADGKEYNGNVTATVTGTAAVIGKIGNDDVMVIPGTASFTNKNAGTDKTVTFSGFSLDGTDKGNYTLSAQPASVTANITAKPLTITGITASNKVYDGTTTVTVTGTPAVSGKVGSDNVTVTLGTASYADKNAGTSKTIIFDNITLGGTDANNYVLAAQPTNVKANISAKLVTLTGVTAGSKVYDGTATATVTGTPSVDGIIGDDAVTLAKGNASFNNKIAGTNKTVTFSGFSLEGTDALNYTVSAQPASVTANISAKPITITGVAATSRAYNGTTTVELTGGVLTGTVSGDAVGFTLGTGMVAIPSAGSNKPVTMRITLTGADASNYTLTQPTGITATITAPTPILSNRENPYIGSIGVKTIGNAILLSNLPQGAKVEVYNLQGKQIYSAYPENPKILRIGVQTKGMYIVKAGSQSARVAVR